MSRFSYPAVRHKLRTGDLAGAEAAFRAQVTHEPGDLAALLGLKQVLEMSTRRLREHDDRVLEARRLGRRADDALEKAFVAFEEGDDDTQEDAQERLTSLAALRADDAALQWRVGEAFRKAGVLAPAVPVYRRYKGLTDDPRGYHMLASVGGVKAPPRAKDDYIVTHFDAVAPDYDEEMEAQGHASPEVVERALRAGLETKTPVLTERGLRALDVGCGTGLCGARLADFVDVLHGVDLSPKMLWRSRQLDIYKELVERELSRYLLLTRRRYEIVVASDAYPFFGTLKRCLGHAGRRLVKHGLLVFTVEHTEDEAGVVLQSTGRFAHSEAHVTEMAERSELRVEAIEAAELRTGVQGRVVTLRKT